MRHNGVNLSESPAALATAVFDSPVGPLTAVATADALVMLGFAEPRRDAVELQKLATAHGHRGPVSAVDAHTHAVLRQTRDELAEYFAGRRVAFGVPLLLPEQAFGRMAWAALAAIPYGQTRSYAQQAAAIGRPTAVRAVARANATNRVAIVLPCHRVIGSDGKLTGFGGGLDRKRWLLDHERRHA